MAIQDERIHACLDGEIPRESLTVDELQRLESLEATLGDARSALRAGPVPDLTQRVMAGLPVTELTPAGASGGAGLLGRLARWFWSPVAVTMRPAYAVAGMAVAAMAFLLLPQTPAGPVLAPVAAESEGEPQLYVQFRIEVPGASEVAVAGTFTAWQPAHDLTEVSPGVWSAMVPLSPGVHDYTFVIDGSRMVVDPYAPSVDDSFGGSNSRLFLPAPNEHV